MDLSKLAPSDGVVALRSFERRYRGLFAEADEDETPDELASRPAASGWTVLEHIVAAAWGIASGARALEAVLTQDEPSIALADVDPAARTRPRKPTGTLHERLAELGLEASTLADRAERVAPKDWDRQGMLDDGSGRRVNALDLLRIAVDIGATHLRDAEQVLAEVRT